MTPEREAQMREMFEKYAEDNGLNTVKGNCGWYISPATSNAYQGFLACARALEPMVMDGERLDWLEQLDQFGLFKNIDHISASTMGGFNGYSTLREAIDVAMNTALEDGNATKQD